MILALDVSTSTVGIACFSDTGDLFEVTHVSPKNNNKQEEGRDKMYGEIDSISSFLINYCQSNNVSNIIIEEPLKNSANPHVASKLNFFGGMLYQRLRDSDVCNNIHYIDINESRTLGVPEIVGESNKMYSDIPKVIEGVKISEYRKLITLYYIGKRFPDVVWTLSPHLLIDKKNFDRADAITLGLAYFHKMGIKKNIPIKEDNNLVEFLTGYLKYLKFCKDNVDKNPVFIKGEKIEVKRDYLINTFKLANYLNVPL